MNIDITFRNIGKDAHASTRAFLEQLVERHLQPHVAAFNTDHLKLHVTVEHLKNSYSVTCRLHLPPRKVLVSHAKGDHLRTVFQEAIEELSRQSERHRAHISGREQWKRKSRRQRLRKMKEKISGSARQPAQAETTLAELMPRLTSYVRHELTYLRANGDLLQDYPSVTDICDEAFVSLQSRWNELQHTQEALYQLLLKAVHEILEKEVAQSHLQNETVSLDAEVEPDAMDQAEAMVEEESGEFFQPDETLHIEDLIPDTRLDTPEQQMEAEALDTCYQLLGNLPIQWRRAFILVYREHIDPADVARQIMDIDEEGLLTMLDYAQAFMLAHFHETGLDSYNPSYLLGLMNKR